MNGLPSRFEYKHSKKFLADSNVSGLIEALEHPDVQRSRFLRGSVVRTLGKLADPQAVPALVDVLENDPDIGSRVFAAAALGKVADARGLPPLRLAVDDPERSLRLWAIDSLGRLEDRESIDRFNECLSDSDSWIREYAARALGKIGDQRATPILVKSLDDPNGRVRKAAASALANLGDWNAIEPLREVHARSGPFRRRVLGRALQELEDRFR